MAKTKLEKFIRLTVSQKMSTPNVKLWFQVVKTFGPQSIIGVIETTDSKKQKRLAKMVAKEFSSGQVSYEIPLTRDILMDECQRIVDQWSMVFEDDFSIESNSNYTDSIYDGYECNDCQSSKLDNADLIAKLMHRRWLLKKQNDGWRYAQTFSQSEKTHPMMMPWEQLPSVYKQVDPQLPKMIADILNT